MKDPFGFRSKIGQNGAIISGSFALQYFARVMWEEADLDIWVKVPDDPADFDELNSLGFYLQEYEGYKKERVPDKVDASQGPYQNTELDKVRSLPILEKKSNRY